MPTRKAIRASLMSHMASLFSPAKQRCAAWVRKPTPTWSWKIDGVALVMVCATLVVDRTALTHSAITAWLNVLSIFALGLILRRNLRRDVKWHDVKQQLAERVSRRQGRPW